MRFFSPDHPDLVTVKKNADNYEIEIDHAAVLKHFYSDDPKEILKLSPDVIVANLLSNLEVAYQNQAHKSVLKLTSREMKILVDGLGESGFKKDYQPKSRDIALMDSKKHLEAVHSGRMCTLALELKTAIQTQQAQVLSKNYVIRR